MGGVASLEDCCVRRTKDTQNDDPNDAGSVLTSGQMRGMPSRQTQGSENTVEESHGDTSNRSNQSGNEDIRRTPIPTSHVSKHWKQAAVGVGAFFEKTDDGPATVRGLAANGPAERKGKMKIGDVLLEVDGHDVTKMSLADIGELLLGAPGTSVMLVLQSRAGTRHSNANMAAPEQYEQHLVRESIKSPGRGYSAPIP